MITLDGGTALAWRLARHGLAPAAAGVGSVVEVTERVVATRAWPAENAALSLALRQREPEPGGLSAALERGDLIIAYALRGGSYVFTPATARTMLTVRTTTRVWESARFQQQGGFEVVDWEPVRSAIRGAVAQGPATRAEIAEHLRASASLRHLADAAAAGAGSDSLYKPLHWWGDLCFGQPRDGQSTFRLLAPEPLPMVVDPADIDTAGRAAMLDYLHAYGPATEANLQYWIGEGLSAPRRKVTQWLADLAEEVVEVSVDGAIAYAAANDLDAIRATDPALLADSLLLLPAYDPWVMGPGTADTRITPPARRAVLSSGKNAVVRRGVVAGTWRTKGAQTEVTWFEEADRPPSGVVEEAIGRREKAG